MTARSEQLLSGVSSDCQELEVTVRSEQLLSGVSSDCQE